MKANIDKAVMNDNIQILGFDIGRGFFKGYSEYNGKSNECMFKSITGLGRHMMDTSKYNDPIYIQYNNIDYFIGELAEIEGDNPTQGLSDDKTSLTVEILMVAGLSKLAESDRVKIVLGVPNKLFNKANRDAIKTKYKNKIYTVKDRLTNSFKRVTIEDIEIFREADAALIWNTKDRESISKPIGMVSMGYRTTEFSYFDKNFRFNDKKSKTKELGNKTALEYVERVLASKEIMRSISEIDSSNEYDNLKEVAYELLKESMYVEIENIWMNLDESEIEIKVAGGTPHHFKDLKYELIPESQMATAKGLFYIGEDLF